MKIKQYFSLLLYVFLISEGVQSRDLVVSEGLYTVPTHSEELKKIASAKISNIVFSADSLSFALPKVLVGPNPYVITFERSETNSNLFNSTFGQAHCLQSTVDQIECNVHYNQIYAEQLQKNIKTTETFLNSLNIPTSERSTRLQLAKEFSGDPIGILKIRL